MVTIQIKTYFDITATLVRHYFKKSAIPFQTADGSTITTEEQWALARNQQRNWETINQVISLRCLPESIGMPVCNNQLWSFEFDINDIEQLENEPGTLDLIKADCINVPLITGLSEKKKLANTLITDDSSQNIWFKVISNMNNL